MPLEASSTVKYSHIGKYLANMELLKLVKKHHKNQKQGPLYPPHIIMVNTCATLRNPMMSQST